MKKFKAIALLLFSTLIFTINTCLAYTPNPEEWEYVASDKSGNSLYVCSRGDCYKAFKNGLRIMTLALTPSGNGTYYLDEVIRQDIYDQGYNIGSGFVCHLALWNFVNGPGEGHMQTPNFVSALTPDGRKIFYSIQDPWFKAEFDYAFKRADELGLNYN